MGELSKLVNLGKVTEAQLNQVNITTSEELRAVGAEEAWKRIYAFDESACMNRLLGLEGAVLGLPKKDIPQQRKAELKAFYQQQKGKKA